MATAKKKESVSLVKDVKFSSDFALRLLIGLLFICIGIQGLIGENNNDLFRYLYKQSEVLSIIFGVIILLAGILLIVPLFLKGINQAYIKASMIAVLVVWILTIIIADFYYGIKGVNGAEWFGWIENLIYHLLILSCVYKVSSGALKRKK